MKSLGITCTGLKTLKLSFWHWFQDFSEHWVVLKPFHTFKQGVCRNLNLWRGQYSEKMIFLFARSPKIEISVGWYPTSIMMCIWAPFRKKSNRKMLCLHFTLCTTMPAPQTGRSKIFSILLMLSKVTQLVDMKSKKCTFWPLKYAPHTKSMDFLAELTQTANFWKTAIHRRMVTDHH